MNINNSASLRTIGLLKGFIRSTKFMQRYNKYIIYFSYLFSSSTSNGIEVQAKNILAKWPTQG